MSKISDGKILITDDDENFREILKLKLQSSGFSNIQEAKNGVEALELIKNFNPDLVILDVVMPDKDGIDTALEIKSKPETQNTKFIFLTSFGEDILKESGREVDQKVAQELGALEFFRKTDPLDLIVEKIKKILEISQ